MRISVTPVHSKQEHFGIKTFLKIKVPKSNKYEMEEEIEDKKNQKTLINSKMFKNNSRNKSLRSKLFVSSLLDK